jgi:gentisate 1,2-dioxygenase
MSDTSLLDQVSSEAAKRARYLSIFDGYNIKLPEIPPRTFCSERDRAMLGDGETACIPVDIAAELHGDSPMTTPMILARYIRIRAGESLTTTFRATGEIYYVICGSGETRSGKDRFAWGPGDVFCLPGGIESEHTAGSEPCVLWQTTNEPQLAIERTEPPPDERRILEPVHYPAAELSVQLERIRDLGSKNGVRSTVVQFSSHATEQFRTITPSFTLGLNSIAPGQPQPPHVHNAAAVMLVIQEEGCHTMVDGERIPWERYATMITPPGAVHSHHNELPEGGPIGVILIVQDGGFYYHCRTMGYQRV